MILDTTGSANKNERFHLLLEIITSCKLSQTNNKEERTHQIQYTNCLKSSWKQFCICFCTYTLNHTACIYADILFVYRKDKIDTNLNT